MMTGLASAVYIYIAASLVFDIQYIALCTECIVSVLSILCSVLSYICSCIEYIGSGRLHVLCEGE